MTTPLFLIPLMGGDTAEVESLPSYLHRCAIAHGCDVGQFIQMVSRLIPGSNLCVAAKVKAKHFKPHELVRPGKLADSIIDSLSEATGQRLEFSVLWILCTVLGRSAGEVVKGFRWCPECLAECHSLGIEPYFKLIWHMTSVTACNIHRTPLIQACEFCGCDQTTYRKRHNIDFCQKCGESLAKRKKKIGFRDLTSSWEDLGNDVIKLFNDLALVDPRSISHDGPHKSMNDLLDYYWNANREDVFYSALTRDEMISLACRDKKVSLLTARRVAFRLGVPLYPFLAGEASQTPGVLDHGVFCTLPDGYLDVRHKSRKNHMAILRKIRQVIRGSDHPLTAKDVCEQAGVSTGYLAYRYPVLYKGIVEKRKAYDEELRLKTIYRAQAAALEYFMSEKYAEAPKSRKQAYRQLREETGLPKWVLKKAIQTAFSALAGHG